MIGLLEMLGGSNKYGHYEGNNDNCLYYMIDDLYIRSDDYFLDGNYDDYAIYTLDSFKEKFPYVVGDEVVCEGYRSKVSKMSWCTMLGVVQYSVRDKGIGRLFYAEDLESPCDIKKRDLDRRYMRMALIWSENSYCERRKVGALIVKDKMIISDGYNGTPSGFENVCELDDGTTKSYVLHAEANAITKIAKTNNSSEGATLYVTMSPCIECAKLIIQSGIIRVVYLDEYRIKDGLELLERAGIEVVRITLED